MSVCVNKTVKKHALLFIRVCVCVCSTIIIIIIMPLSLSLSISLSLYTVFFLFSLTFSYVFHLARRVCRCRCCCCCVLLVRLVFTPTRLYHALRLARRFFSSPLHHLFLLLSLLYPLSSLLLLSFPFASTRESPIIFHAHTHTDVHSRLLLLHFVGFEIATLPLFTRKLSYFQWRRS